METKTFYTLEIEVCRNIGNYKYDLIFKKLENAKKRKAEINAHENDQNITQRDSIARRITRHTFKDNGELYKNDKYCKLENMYFDQWGKFPY